VSLVQIADYWWWVTGCSRKKLIERILFELVRPTPAEPDGWEAFSFRRNCHVHMRPHYLTWARIAGLESSAPEAWLHAFLGEDIALRPEQVARLAVALKVPPPAWLADWQFSSPDLLDEMLQKYGKPANHPRRSKGFCDEYRSRAATDRDRVLQDDAIHSRIRRRRKRQISPV
jgi:hypothetical protein